MEGRAVLAIDPGHSKCGIAVVRAGRKRGAIAVRDVVAADNLAQTLVDLDRDHDFDIIVVGDGTNSTRIQEVVRTTLPGRSMMVVDERDTSIRARERYWIETPRRGWRWLLPSSMQVPPVPIDDFVAVILAERALNAD